MGSTGEVLSWSGELAALLHHTHMTTMTVSAGCLLDDAVWLLGYGCKTHLPPPEAPMLGAGSPAMLRVKGEAEARIRDRPPPATDNGAA